MDTIGTFEMARALRVWVGDKVTVAIRSERIRLVLNRFRKISGFTESDAEAATGAKLLWKIPNHFSATANAIDRGIPVAQQNHSAIARSFVGLSSALGPKKPATKPSSWFSLGA